MTSNTRRTVLVTGGTGALGTAVTERLLADASISFLASDAAGQLRGAWLPVYGSA